MKEEKTQKIDTSSIQENRALHNDETGAVDESSAGEETTTVEKQDETLGIETAEEDLAETTQLKQQLSDATDKHLDVGQSEVNVRNEQAEHLETEEEEQPIVTESATGQSGQVLDDYRTVINNENNAHQCANPSPMSVPTTRAMPPMAPQVQPVPRKVDSSVKVGMVALLICVAIVCVMTIVAGFGISAPVNAILIAPLVLVGLVLIGMGIANLNKKETK